MEQEWFVWYIICNCVLLYIIVIYKTEVILHILFCDLLLSHWIIYYENLPSVKSFSRVQTILRWFTMIPGPSSAHHCVQATQRAGSLSDLPFVFSFLVLGVEFMTLHLPNRHCATEPGPSDLLLTDRIRWVLNCHFWDQVMRRLSSGLSTFLFSVLLVMKSTVTFITCPTDIVTWEGRERNVWPQLGRNCILPRTTWVGLKVELLKSGFRLNLEMTAILANSFTVFL